MIGRKTPPIVAYAVVYPRPMMCYRGGDYALFIERSTAEQRAAGARGSELRVLAEVPKEAIDEAVANERAKLLRKFDDYVPADQVSSLRWRVLELEEELRILRGDGRQPVQRDGDPADPPAFPPTVAAEWQGKPFQPLPVRNKLPVPEVTVITDPAVIAAAFEADALSDSEGGEV